jgi:hypothetical protein
MGDEAGDILRDVARSGPIAESGPRATPPELRRAPAPGEVRPQRRVPERDHAPCAAVCPSPATAARSHVPHRTERLVQHFPLRRAGRVKPGLRDHRVAELHIKAGQDGRPHQGSLHGGIPDYFLTASHPTGLEDDFIVVWWEQRGSGITEQE